MRIESLQALHDAPKADLYVCCNLPSGAQMATPHVADVKHFLMHCGSVGYVETYTRQLPSPDTAYDPLCDAQDVEFLKQYADAIVAGLTRRRASVPLTLSQEAELKVAQVALKALLREQTPPIKITAVVKRTDPRQPSTWPEWKSETEKPFVVDWDAGDHGPCHKCGRTTEITALDPGGMARCSYCFDEIVADHKFTCPRCNKTLITPRASGSHYCHIEDPKDE